MKGMGFIRAVATVLSLGLYRGKGRMSTPPGPYVAESVEPALAAAANTAVTQSMRGGVDPATFGQSNYCARLRRKNKLRALGLAGNQR